MDLDATFIDLQFAKIKVGFFEFENAPYYVVERWVERLKELQAKEKSEIDKVKAAGGPSRRR